MQKKPSLLSAKFKKQQKKTIKAVEVDDVYANATDEQLDAELSDYEEMQKKLDEESEKQSEEIKEKISKSSKEDLDKMQNKLDILNSYNISLEKAEEYEEFSGKRSIYNGKITNGFFNWYINHEEDETLKWINTDNLTKKQQISLKYKIGIHEKLEKKVESLKEYKTSEKSEKLAEKLNKEVQEHITPLKEIRQYQKNWLERCAYIWPFFEHMTFDEDFIVSPEMFARLDEIEKALIKAGKYTKEDEN